MKTINLFKPRTPLVLMLLTGAMLTLGSCSDTPSDVTQVNSLPQIFPDYAGVTIPAEIAPLNFNAKDNDADALDVEVKGSKGGTLHANGQYADFDVDDWHDLTAANKGGTLTFTVTIKKGGQWKLYRDFTVNVSADPLGEWGLTYRLIPPGYEVYGKHGIYERDLSTFDERPIFENTAVPGACVNCHMSNRTNPDQFTFHVRGANGATYIQQKGDFEVLKAKNDSIHGSMVYPYWHPSGKLVAYSTNQTAQSFHAVKNERIEVFDQASDILIYNPSSHELVLNPDVMTQDHFETYPVFSPDGKTLYFVSSQAWDIPQHYKNIQYNVCRVGFDPQTGRTVGKVDTIFNARNLGKSATHPRPSYDGRYLLFTMSDYGCFPIWHKESDQWLLDLHTLKARPLTEINSNDADSYHNWSANSHWIVFTSRRLNGYYTNLYLAHIDAQGRMGKPFLLPQRDPWTYYDQTVNSFNTPDFTLRPVDLDARAVGSALLAPDRVPTKVK